MAKRFTVLLCLGAAFLCLPAEPARAQTADDLFKSQSLQRVELWMNKLDWAKLSANFQENTYYPADLVWNGQTVRNIGIRSRGRGSRSATKPGLRLDFNRYQDGQTFLDMKALDLDNLTQDPSGIHETVSMAFYNRLGIPAPLEIHTRLYVNGTLVGLYSIIEEVDKGLLARAFGKIGEDTQNDGHLYEFHYADDWRFKYLGSGLEEYKIRFSPVTHADAGDEKLYRPIENLVKLVNETPVDRFKEVIGPLLDIPAFVRFIAAEAFLADTDCFVGNFGINNFYLYRLENSDQHVLIPWDSDNAFWGPTFSIDTSWNKNVLVDKVMAIPEYAALYKAEIQRDVDFAEADGGWLNNEIIRQVQLIDGAMKEDPSKPYSLSTYEGSVGVMLGFANDHLKFVKCELANGVGKCQ